MIFLRRSHSNLIRGCDWKFKIYIRYGVLVGINAGEVAQVLVYAAVSFVHLAVVVVVN